MNENLNKSEERVVDAQEMTQEQIDAEIKLLMRNMKKRLKPLSKSKLIEIIADQANRFHIMQDINKILLDEKKELKKQIESLGESNENS